MTLLLTDLALELLPSVLTFIFRVIELIAPLTGRLIGCGDCISLFFSIRVRVHVNISTVTRGDIRVVWATAHGMTGRPAESTAGGLGLLTLEEVKSKR